MRNYCSRPFLAAIALFCGTHLNGARGDEPQPKYPDFGFAPKDYGGILFKLSQDYPTQKPDAAKLPPFFQSNLADKDFRRRYKQNWRDYMAAIRDYCFEGNLAVDWRVEENEVRDWYHMPWQHWGRFGREGLRGLTKEASVKPKQLGPLQETKGQTYAVAFYNEFAGHLLGQIWQDPDAPDVEAIESADGFLHGSVIFKLLFVDVPLNEVPSLVDPILWQAYITPTFESDERAIRNVALIQMDVMVKDDRADNGWLFGTFQYNGRLQNTNRWDNLVPVGLQWGNDPDVKGDDFTNATPTATRINPALKETVINPDENELPPTHLGWNGRLNGPVDNPKSSCMSCHQTSQHPFDIGRIMAAFSASPPPAPGSDEWMVWFQNNDCMEPFDKGRTATDGSMQLAMSLKNFFSWKNDRGGSWSHKRPTSHHAENPHGQSR